MITLEEGRKLNLNLKDNFDVIVSLVIVGIVLMMIIPLPAGMLDVLIAINIAFSVIIVLITMFTTEVLQFSVFPTLLLITTLLDLHLIFHLQD